jgi:hypothetical protein
VWLMCSLSPPQFSAGLQAAPGGRRIPRSTASRDCDQDRLDLRRSRPRSISNDFSTIRVDRQLRTTEPTWKPPKTPSSARTMARPRHRSRGDRGREEDLRHPQEWSDLHQRLGQPDRQEHPVDGLERGRYEGTTDATTHDLRYYFASMHIRAGTDQGPPGAPRPQERRRDVGHLRTPTTSPDPMLDSGGFVPRLHPGM